MRFFVAACVRLRRASREGKSVALVVVLLLSLRCCLFACLFVAFWFGCCLFPVFALLACCVCCLVLLVCILSVLSLLLLVCFVALLSCCLFSCLLLSFVAVAVFSFLYLSYLACTAPPQYGESLCKNLRDSQEAQCQAWCAEAESRDHEEDCQKPNMVRRSGMPKPTRKLSMLTD